MFVTLCNSMSILPGGGHVGMPHGAPRVARRGTVAIGWHADSPNHTAASGDRWRRVARMCLIVEVLRANGAVLTQRVWNMLPSVGWHDGETVPVGRHAGSPHHTAPSGDGCLACNVVEVSFVMFVTLSQSMMRMLPGAGHDYATRRPSCGTPAPPTTRRHRATGCNVVEGFPCHVCHVVPIHDEHVARCREL